MARKCYGVHGFSGYSTLMENINGWIVGLNYDVYLGLMGLTEVQIAILYH